MKKKTKFLKIFYKLPNKAREELVYRYYDNPMTLNVIALEVRNDTKMSVKILKKLGFEDD